MSGAGAGAGADLIGSEPESAPRLWVSEAGAAQKSGGSATLIFTQNEHKNKIKQIFSIFANDLRYLLTDLKKINTKNYIFSKTDLLTDFFIDLT